MRRRSSSRCSRKLILPPSTGASVSFTNPSSAVPASDECTVIALEGYGLRGFVRLALSGGGGLFATGDRVSRVVTAVDRRVTRQITGSRQLGRGDWRHQRRDVRL